MNADTLNAHLTAGGFVQVTTYLRSTLYGPKHVGWFTNGSDGCLYVRQGRGKACLSLTNGRLLVGIRLSRLSK